MNNLERLSLVTKIAYELQDRMTFQKIQSYLRGFDVEIPEEWSGPNSKRVYVEDILGSVSAATVVSVANELQIPHPHTVTPAKGVVESDAWKANHFKLFISHLSELKKQVGQLQTALLKYGISAFVAHEDIEPSREWQDEIEVALQSMDAMAVVLMPGFKESDWTDQEVGFAMCRGVLVVPVMRGLRPYGFIAKYQGFHVGEKTVQQVAAEVFQTIVRSPLTRNRMLNTLVDLAVSSTSKREAAARLEALESVYDIPVAYLERLSEGARASKVLMQDESLKSWLNEVLAGYGLPPVDDTGDQADTWSDEEIPF